MLGEFAISETSLSSHGILQFGSESLDFNFTGSQNGNLVAYGLSEMIGTASKANIAVGILVGALEGSLNFTQTSDGLLVASGVNGITAELIQSTEGTRVRPALIENNFNFAQNTPGIYIASGIYEQTAEFTQSADGDYIAGGVSTIDMNFEQSANANMKYSGFADIIGNFEMINKGSVIQQGTAELEALFRTYPFGGILIYNAEAHSNTQFDIIITNRLFWEPIDASVPPESWIQIVPTSSNWVKIAAMNPGVWTKKTV